MSKTLVKVFTGGLDGYDSLQPLYDAYRTASIFQLPRGYRAETDERGKPYILCPNGERVYDLDQSRSDSKTVKFSYMINGRKRTVRLHVDEDATRNMIFGGEDYMSSHLI